VRAYRVTLRTGERTFRTVTVSAPTSWQAVDLALLGDGGIVVDVERA
jgi:hypothetical protein